MKSDDYNFVVKIVKSKKPQQYSIYENEIGITIDCDVDDGERIECRHCEFGEECNEIFFVSLPRLVGEEAELFKKEYPEYFI